MYKELGTDKVLLYARFDDKDKDFPIDTKFAQVGIVKNPTSIGSTNVYTGSSFSSLGAIKFVDSTTKSPNIGEVINQQLPNGNKAYGIVASFDDDTKVLKYYQDRSLYFHPTEFDQTDRLGVSNDAIVYSFDNDTTGGAVPANVKLTLVGVDLLVKFKQHLVELPQIQLEQINSLGTEFTDGLSEPEIIKGLVKYLLR